MEVLSNAFRFGFLVFITLFVLAEAFWLIHRRGKSYPVDQAVASFAVAFIRNGINALTVGMSGGLMLWVYEHRLFTFDITGPVTLFGAFLAVEFFYYWHHRFTHEVRWLWATHAVHHSPAEMNLSVAVRLGWTSLLSGSILFYAPLALLGIHPVAVFALMSAGLVYQFWIHTELVPRFGKLDWVLNTPSNHRVHHASNPKYLDKNYGSVLMIFDVIFGTYAAEEEGVPIQYGITEPMISSNPFKIALFEWGRMIRDVKKARSVRDVFGYLFGRPGWRPHQEPLRLLAFQPQDATNAPSA
ncbi:MAG: sterol desaturase family protein [Pseudomonadota bacterium]